MSFGSAPFAGAPFATPLVITAVPGEFSGTAVMVFSTAAGSIEVAKELNGSATAVLSTATASIEKISEINGVATFVLTAQSSNFGLIKEFSGSAAMVLNTSAAPIEKIAALVGTFVAELTVPPATFVLGPSITLTLTDCSDILQPNETGIKWAWFDEATPDQFNAPTAKGTLETTDAGAVLTIDITGTSLTSGQIGWLVITDSDGNPVTSHRVGAGPVEVN